LYVISEKTPDSPLVVSRDNVINTFLDYAGLYITVTVNEFVSTLYESVENCVSGIA